MSVVADSDEFIKGCEYEDVAHEEVGGGPVVVLDGKVGDNSGQHQYGRYQDLWYPDVPAVYVRNLKLHADFWSF